MNRRDLRAVCLHLRTLAIDYVLVGGMAVELGGYSTGTEDVDFAVTVKQYLEALEKLSADRRFRAVEDQGTIGGGQFFTGERWIDVELINPKLFRGPKSDDFFITYLKRYRSRKTDLGPVANPEVAWYMRLAIPDWEIYVQKILRDVRAGVPLSTLDGAGAIARVLGTEASLAPRVEKTRRMAAMTA